jgi:hypothetical protein
MKPLMIKLFQFELAEQSGKCRYLGDIPLMKSLIAELDTLMDKDNEKVKKGITAVVKKFNERWESTPTWTFKLEVYENPVLVGKEIFNRVADEVDEKYVVEEFGMSENDWMDICEKAIADDAAQEQFSERLSEAGWF